MFLRQTPGTSLAFIVFVLLAVPALQAQPASSADEKPTPFRIVVEDEEGRLVAGADLQLFSPTSRGSAKTTAEGRAQLFETMIPESFDLIITAPGFQTAVYENMTWQPDEARFVLKKGITLRGKTVDPGGAPVAGVNVRASHRNRHVSNVDTQSKSDGSFELLDLTAGDVTLGAWKEGGIAQGKHLSLWGYDEPDVLMVVDPVVVVSGKILDLAQGPVERARIVLTETSTEKDITEKEIVWYSEKDGTFFLRNVPPGDYRIRVEHGGFETVETEASFPGHGPLELSFRAQRERTTVFGRVVDENGAGIPGVRVSLLGDNAVTTDASGLYEMKPETKPGEASRSTLTASKPGYSKHLEVVELEDGERHEVMIQLHSGVTIQGRVLGLLPGDVEKMAVRAQNSEGKIQEDGTFTIPNVPPGTWNVFVEIDESDRRVVQEVTVRAGTELTGLEMRMPGGYRLSGQVFLEGEPLNGAFVTIFCEDGGGATVHAKTSREGRFQHPLVAEGTDCSLWVSHSGTIFAFYETEMIADNEMTLELEHGILSGVVVDEEGEPLAGVKLDLYAQVRSTRVPWDRPKATVLSDDKGRFEFPRITQTRWRLLIEHEGYELVDEWLFVTSAKQEEIVQLRALE